MARVEFDDMPRAQNRKRTAPGRPFQPGQSGNPGGRPKGLGRLIRERVGDDGAKVVEFMIEVLEDEKAPLRQRMEAATWLADRGFGKPSPTAESPEGEVQEEAETEETIERLAEVVAESASRRAQQPVGAGSS